MTTPGQILAPIGKAALRIPGMRLTLAADILLNTAPRILGKSPPGISAVTTIQVATLVMIATRIGTRTNVGPGNRSKPLTRVLTPISIPISIPVMTKAPIKMLAKVLTGIPRTGTTIKYSESPVLIGRIIGNGLLQRPHRKLRPADGLTMSHHQCSNAMAGAVRDNPDFHAAKMPRPRRPIQRPAIGMPTAMVTQPGQMIRARPRAPRAIDFAPTRGSRNATSVASKNATVFVR